MIEAFYCQTDTQGHVWPLLAYAYAEIFGGEIPQVAKHPSGKPYFPDHPLIHFSVSHARGAVLVTLSDSICGCDIESLRPRAELLAPRIASQAELEEFSFLDLWVLKESYVKLVGCVPGDDIYGFMRASSFLRSEGGIVCPRPDVHAGLYELSGRKAAVACAGQDAPSALRSIEMVDILPFAKQGIYVA